MARRLSIRERLEHLESLGRNQAAASIGVQPDVTAAIAEYLECLREWCRSGASEKLGRSVSSGSSAKNLADLPANSIGTQLDQSGDRASTETPSLTVSH
jgi:hypothetical protein